MIQKGEVYFLIVWLLKFSYDVISIFAPNGEFLDLHSEQKYSDASNILYILHIKLQLIFFLSWSQFMSDFDPFCFNKNRI